MKRLLVILSVVAPAVWLVVAALFPALDPVFEVPLFHFYVVTFFTFAAAVVAFFTTIALGSDSQPRHQLLATAFAVMGTLFFVHGVTTPNALMMTLNPGVRWAAWLTLFLGALIFAVAALDTPQRPLILTRLTLVRAAFAIFVAGFILIVIFVPGWLGAIDAQAAPWHQQLVFGSTLLIWIFAAVQLWRTWRSTRLPVDGVMALVAAWFAVGTVSLHGFETWRLSWWLYHGQLLLGVVTAVWALSRTYEQLRHFRLTTYYAALGLIVTGGLALFTSHFVSRLVERSLWAQLSLQMPDAAAAVMASTEATQIVVTARLQGLLIAGGAMGLLFLILMVVIRRADKLIHARSQELARAYADLKAAEVMRDDLADMIVHDLRTPLTSIRLSLDLMEKMADDAEQRTRFIANSKASAQQMLVLVNQILDVAKLEAGQLKPDYETISAAALLQEKAQIYRPQADSEQKQFEMDVAPDLPPFAADKGLLGRVLDNLVTNAIKYTEPNGRIQVRAWLNGTAVLFQVADDGAGIPPSVADNIFDKFYQATDEDGKPIRRGTGLGLTFCKLVVEAHNGRIWVDSQPGQGSTFSFTIPCKS